jgi:hypothetical protein
VPAGLSLAGTASSGLGDWVIRGRADVAPGSYVIRVAVTDGDGGRAESDVRIAVTREDAAVSYSGLEFVSTSSANDTDAVVPLRATVRDITAVLPGLDPHAGTSAGPPSPSSTATPGRSSPRGCRSPPRPGRPEDRRRVVRLAGGPGNADAQSFTVGVVVEGYYTRNSTADDGSSPSPPLSNFITGGGYVLNQSSAGAYAGDAGSQTNFGFNVKFNKQLTNLQGQVNVIVRRDARLPDQGQRAEVAGGRSAHRPRGPDGQGQPARRDDPANPISLGGTLLLEMRLTDRGEPGGFDSIGVSLGAGRAAVLHPVDGGANSRAALAGGNLVVHKEQSPAQNPDVAATKFFVVDAGPTRLPLRPGRGRQGTFVLDGRPTPGRGEQRDGDTVWVIDRATGKVFVHAPARRLRGSWQPLGPQDPQGLATDGTDVWS